MVIKKENKPYRFVLVSLIWAGIGLLSIVPALFFVAFYDSPSKLGSADSFAIWGVISFPVICIGSSIAILILSKLSRRLAFYVSLLPLFPIIVCFSVIFLPNLFLCGSLSCQPSSSLQAHGNATLIAKCAPPILDMKDGLVTTGCGTLEFGLTGTGKTYSTSEAHQWQFSTQNRFQLAITLENDGKSCPQIRIFDSSGRLIEGFDDRNKSGLYLSSWLVQLPFASQRIM
jgi:hypothetical protein